MTQPTVCLNMIVKNESAIITRLLESVLHIIDTYCICDTGSTDNTVDIIKTYFENKGIDGKIVHKDFVNFGENRTYAAQCAYDMADYLLFLDADMILKISSDFDRSKLTKKAYTILQGNTNMHYWNTRLVHTSLKPVYIGVTHEYVNTRNCNPEKLYSISINDIGDGGCKADKFERDARLLEKGILDEPENVTRYRFYLGNTYRCLHNYEKALYNYEERIKLGGWEEEVFYSMYYMGLCYKQMNREDAYVNTMLKTWNYRKTRIEPLYSLIEYYCNTNKHHLAKLIYQTAKDIKVPGDMLFVENHMYNESLCNLHTLFSYYCGDTKDVYKSFEPLFNGNSYSYVYCMNNYKFYKPNINRVKTISMNCEYDIELDGVMTKYYGSSPSIVIDKQSGNYFINIRLVSYKINENGCYIGPVSTQNKFVEMDREFNVIRSELISDTTIPSIPSHWNDKLHGIEDIKLYYYNDSLYFTGTSLHDDGGIGTVYGIYDTTGKTKLEPIQMKREASCEKNWMPISGDSKKFIYKWSPITVCELEDDNSLRILSMHKTPKLFTNARGSSPGFEYEGELWFVVHYVHIEDGLRTYYNGIAILDNNFNLKRYTLPFKLYNHRIEYCLGIVVEKDRLLFTISENDGSSEIVIIKKSELELFHYA